MIREVRLYRHLGRRFGRVHRLDVASAGEAVRALCVNFPDFERHVIEHNDPGYRVVTDVGPVTVDHLKDPCKGAIKIIPIVAGGKSKMFGIILGTALIAAAFFLPTTTLFTVGNLSVSMASIAFSVGGNLLLSGISSMLTPTPKRIESPERPDTRPSFIFNGAVNTIKQGGPVPIGYGRMRIGSQVISAGMFTESL